MRITAVLERAVNLQGNVANAIVDFSTHTVSLVALVSDQTRGGKPVVGVAFNSIGRFAQSGIIRDRMAPRLLAAPADTLANPTAPGLDPRAVLRCIMANEKPGGHGDRASAAAAIELAVWDLNAKLADEPACHYIARTCHQPGNVNGAPVYAAGGYYYPQDSTTRLRDELRGYREQGYEAFKIKIGGAPLATDMQRVQAAVDVAGHADCVAADANARFDAATAQAYGDALADYPLRWYEEPCDPLDFATLHTLTQRYPGRIATGENIFSAIDATNLTRYAGLRANQDILQMDPGLSYGLSEYLDIVRQAESAGFDRSQCIPHGGHLINLHIVTALGLGGCEAYPGVFAPFGGYSPQCKLADGRVWPTDAPGFGLEQKPDLGPLITDLITS